MKTLHLVETLLFIVKHWNTFTTAKYQMTWLTRCGKNSMRQRDKTISWSRDQLLNLNEVNRSYDTYSTEKYSPVLPLLYIYTYTYNLCNNDNLPICHIPYYCPCINPDITNKTTYSTEKYSLVLPLLYIYTYTYNLCNNDNLPICHIPYYCPCINPDITNKLLIVLKNTPWYFLFYTSILRHVIYNDKFERE